MYQTVRQAEDVCAAASFNSVNRNGNKSDRSVEMEQDCK